MENFTSVQDVDSFPKWVSTAQKLKENPLDYSDLGRNKTLGLIFFNPSIRTRLSTQKAAQNLGMNVIVMNINQEGWKIEVEDGTVMNGDKAEHVKDAVGVMGQYCDIIGVRSFARLENREEDYAEKVLGQFTKYAGVPVISLESATRHPLQSFTDLITIEEFKKIQKPKVVLTWAPHPKALPQAVANSFVEWMKPTEYDLVITHPKGYELSPEFAKNVSVEYDQQKALEGADFVYTKNWASYQNYGQVLKNDLEWTVTQEKMQKTNNAFFMHCMPVRRNLVATDEVMDHTNSLILRQAANRVVAAQTVLKELLTQKS